MNRRHFLSIAAISGALSPVSRVLSQITPGKPSAPDSIMDGAALVATTDRARILRAANAYLTQRPITVTASHATRSPGGPHDYFSQGDYWWPNPKDPSAPYIQRDGETNPENFEDHRTAMRRLSVQVPALVAAYVLTKDERYAKHAALHLRAWFVTPATRMNPNLEYSQTVIGMKTLRGIGIIDTLHLAEVAQAARFLQHSKALPPKEYAAVQSWFAEYITWLTTSPKGLSEQSQKNNHGACWVLQVAAFSAFTGNTGLTAFCRDRFKTVLVPTQIAPDGSLPLELRRTKPYSYSIFCLDVLTDLCQLLSTPTDNLWQFKGPNGAGIREAIAFLYPYLKDKSKWPYAHDVQHWDDFPVRQPNLLFGGLAYNNLDYIALWKTLNPDSTVEEVIRNCPVRQPLLWVSKPA
jgi:hypothetical protein